MTRPPRPARSPAQKSPIAMVPIPSRRELTTFPRVRNPPACLNVLLLSAILSLQEAEAADLPGHESALLAFLEDKRMAWVNPARISTPGEAGMDLGYSLTSPVQEYLVRLHFPLGFGFAYEGSGVDWPLEYSSGDFSSFNATSNYFHTIALAKAGFGPSPWLTGLNLGLATRYFYSIKPGSFSGNEGEAGNIWSLEGGMAWTLPGMVPWGDLTLGLFTLQTSSRLAVDRMEGVQARWMDASGLWDLSGNFILDYPRYRPEMDPYLPLQSRHGTHSLGLTLHKGRWDLGAVGFPTYRIAGAKVRWKIETRSLLRRFSLGLEAYGGGAMAYRQMGIYAGGISFEGDFRTPKDEAVVRSYADYRRNRAEATPGRAPEQESADPATAAARGIAPDPAHLDPAIPGPGVQDPNGHEPLSEEQWRRNMADYERERIGTFRGVVWPYLNTFGYFTTYIVPAGTSSLAVGETVPGFTMLLIWCGLFAGLTLDAEDFGPLAMTYVVGQPALKLVDLYLARRHVNGHNRALKEKYRLTMQPQPRLDGAGALVVLDF